MDNDELLKRMREARISRHRYSWPNYLAVVLMLSAMGQMVLPLPKSLQTGLFVLLFGSSFFCLGITGILVVKHREIMYLFKPIRGLPAVLLGVVITIVFWSGGLIWFYLFLFRRH